MIKKLEKAVGLPLSQCSPLKKLKLLFCNVMVM